MTPITRQGGTPKALEKQIAKQKRPPAEKTMQVLIQFRIWGDLGRHFGPQGVPLGCQNLHFFIKYTLGAPKNWFSERSKKNNQISLIFVAKMIDF